jgi:hypothetical protein
VKKQAKTHWYPMRIQARPGSKVEKDYYLNAALPGGAWPAPKAIAKGIDPAPLQDLLFHGGRVIPQMLFQNCYLGSESDWSTEDIRLIDSSILRAMQDVQLNNVMVQYFPGAKVSCEALHSVVLSDPAPVELDEPDVQAKVVSLFEAKAISGQDLDNTIFNLVLPPGTILKLGTSSSSDGLGGYHGSVHARVAGRPVRLYYSANVYSQTLADGTENGIPVFDKSWKNVVATLYHEINEFRTDADVRDAIETQNNDALGWMSRQGLECGDQPIFAAGQHLNRVFQEITATGGGAKIPVQFLYSNVVHGAEGPIPAPDAQRSATAAA